VLVIADGAHTLTAPAPGGYNPASVPVQHAVDDVLARGHIAALTALPTNIVGRVAFQVLAGLAEPEARSCTEFYRGAPYGVGYFVGVWQP
jgi:aromatic ring-opening dioxygenase LigB subunit